MKTVKADTQSTIATSPVKVAKILGGGESWYYAILDNKIIDAAHEDNSEGMLRLQSLKDPSKTKLNT